MPRKPTFLMKLDNWILALEGRNYSTATIRGYRIAVSLAWRWGSKVGWEADPKKLTPAQMRAYLDHLQKFSSATQANYGTALLLFLRWNGNRNFDQFRLGIQVERIRVDWFTVEEVSAVLASAPSLQIKAMETMFAYTGIRLSELAKLRLTDLHDGFLVVQGKGRKARRVPLTPAFWDAMRAYLDWRRTQPGDMLIVHPALPGYPAGPYTMDGIKTALYNHWKLIGRHISAHTFRRSFGRHLYKAGMPLPEIQRLYGHASVEMTVEYLGIIWDDLDDSLNRFQPRY